MNDQEIPVEERVQPSSQEHHEDEVARKPETPPPEADASDRYEHVWPTMPPPSIPFTQPPYTWPTYAPGTEQQWRSRGQFAAPYARKHSRWPWIVLSLVLLFMLITGGTFFLVSSLGYNSGSSVTETQRFSVSANPTLILNNDIGTIQVRTGGSGNEVSIQATRHSGLWSNINDIHVNYAQDTGSNTVTVNVNRPANMSFFNSSSVDFAITVPGTAVLQLKTNTGNIDVNGVSGRMELTSNTGSVQASGGTLSGNSSLITNTGSITFNGSIGESGTYQFQTNTGSVNVTLPGGSVFHVDASTDTGSINTTFPGVTVQQHQFVGADVHSDVGNAPQATISLRTNTGTINLYQR